MSENEKNLPQASLTNPAPTVPDLFLVDRWTSITDPIDAYNASRATGLTVDDIAGKPILVQDAYVKKIPMPDQATGEIRLVPRTVLVSPKDKQGNVTYYQFVSDGVVGCLNDLMATFGPMPWASPMKLMAEKVKAKKGSTINLRVVR